MFKRYDEKYRFYSLFNPETGLYFRSNIHNELNEDTGREAFMGSFPHLLDIGIMGRCDHGRQGLCLQSGVQCYQSGVSRVEENMAFADFKRIAEECEGRVYQFALGGRGDPEMHPDFERILNTSRERSIVPNLTTSGFGLTDQKAGIMKKYCGAVAVSWYRSEYTLRALKILVNRGIKTNIHYVLGKNSLEEAVFMLENLDNLDFLNGVERIIFLLHKPVGLGQSENVLTVADKRVRYFFSLFSREEICQKTGFDSCCVPGILNMAHEVHPASIEACEASRFSAYITPDLKMLPCSFDQDYRWAADLRRLSIEEAWYSNLFNAFRSLQSAACPDCGLKYLCYGGCVIKKEIVLCTSIQGGVPVEGKNGICD